VAEGLPPHPDFDLLDGKGIDMPKSVPGQFKQAEKVRKKEGKQGELGI